MISLAIEQANDCFWKLSAALVFKRVFFTWFIKLRK